MKIRFTEVRHEVRRHPRENLPRDQPGEPAHVLSPVQLLEEGKQRRPSRRQPLRGDLLRYGDPLNM